jgi:MutS domain I protein
MSFGKMVELLQRKDKGKIILVNAGSFYIARGKDAVLLHNILNLKVNCMEAEICKIGFPLNSLEKYTELIEQEQYSYIVYNFDNKLGKLDIIKKYNGKKINTIKEEKLNCYICTNTVKMYKKNDIYIQAVANLYEEENKKTEKEQNKEKQKGRKIIWKLKR